MNLFIFIFSSNWTPYNYILYCMEAVGKFIEGKREGEREREREGEGGREREDGKGGRRGEREWEEGSVICLISSEFEIVCELGHYLLIPYMSIRVAGYPYPVCYSSMTD